MLNSCCTFRTQARTRKHLTPDIPLGGAERLHEPCRMFSGIFSPVFLTNSYGYCLVKRLKICS